VSKGIKTQFNSNLEVRKSFGTRYPETTRKNKDNRDARRLLWLARQTLPQG